MTTRTRNACFAALLFMPSIAYATTRPWSLRLEAGTSQYSRDTFASYAGIHYTELSLNDGHALAIAAEYRPTSLLGVELSFGSVELDARWREVEIRPISFNPTVLEEVTVDSDSGDFALRPITLGLLVHPLRRDRIDFYVGPQLGRTSFHIDLHGPPSRDPEWTFGGKAGVEVRMADSPWSAGLAYRYLETQHDGQEHDPYTGLSIHLFSAVLSYGKAPRGD